MNILNLFQGQIPLPNEVNGYELGHEVNSEIGSQSYVSDNPVSLGENVVVLSKKVIRISKTMKYTC